MLALTLNNSLVSTYNTTNVGNISFTVGASDNLLVAIICSAQTYATTKTWNGDNLFSATGTHADNNGDTVEIAWLNNPTTGTHNANFAFQGGGIPTVSITLLSFSNADPYSPKGNVATAGWNWGDLIASPSASIVTTRPNEIIVGAMRAYTNNGGPTYTENSGQTRLYSGRPNGNNGQNHSDDVMYKSLATPGSTTVGFSLSGYSGGAGALAAVAFRGLPVVDNLFEAGN